jgi:hypothetical protein
MHYFPARRRLRLAAMRDLIRGGSCPLGLPCCANTYKIMHYFPARSKEKA